jgi:hypothetical protein
MAARADLRPTFVPRRLVIGTAPGVASGTFVKKVVKAVMGRWARPLVKLGTTVLLQSAL